MLTISALASIEARYREEMLEMPVFQFTGVDAARLAAVSAFQGLWPQLLPLTPQLKKRMCKDKKARLAILECDDSARNACLLAFLVTECPETIWAAQLQGDTWKAQAST
jgi:hypothetical protein